MGVEDALLSAGPYRGLMAILITGTSCCYQAKLHHCQAAADGR